MRHVAIALASLLLAAPAASADVSLRWSVPERLAGGTNGVARSVAEAAAVPAAVITLRTCAPDPSWTLDGRDVHPAPAGRCAYRLDLGDHAAHELKLSSSQGDATEHVQARALTIVSLGDSVASGEGDPDVAGAVAPRWLEPRCHRSMRSGAAQAALAVAAGDPHSAVTFLPLACSGATVPAGLLGAYAGIQPDGRSLFPPQLDELRALERRRPVDAVLLSVGANDVYFGALARFCMAVPDCPQRRFDPRHPGGEAPPGTPTAEEAHAAAERALAGRYDGVAAALSRMGVKPEQVIVVEYFDPTGDGHGDTCSSLLPGITAGEAEWARATVLGQLNVSVRDAAQRHGWRLVTGVASAFAGHGICAPRSVRWIRRIDESLLRGARLSGPLHPNTAGHLATAALIAPVLADVTGMSPGDAVAQASGAPDDEGDGVSPWWLPVDFVAGAALALLASAVIRRRRRRAVAV